MGLKIVLINILCLAFCSGIALECSARRQMGPSGLGLVVARVRTTDPIVRGDDYGNDVAQLMALRLHPLDELIALATRLEEKWRVQNWNQYAEIMKYVCSEISNRGLNDPKVREFSELFVRVALSHSSHYGWEHQAAFVGWLGYQRSAVDDKSWLNERSEKAKWWLRTWQRLEKQTDASFNINDRKNQPSMRVSPPFETGLPAGTSPSAIKDPRLRARYEAAIADNQRKSQRINEQLPLRLHGPAFKNQTERWLIEAYSQPPSGLAELRRFLKIYVQDYRARQRILNGVVKNSK